jgi:hypothetical protein
MSDHDDPLDPPLLAASRRDGALGPIALDPAVSARTLARVQVEVAARRAQLLEGALHAGFAVAAVAWALLVAVGPR